MQCRDIFVLSQCHNCVQNYKCVTFAYENGNGNMRDCHVIFINDIVITVNGNNDNNQEL